MRIFLLSFAAFIYIIVLEGGIALLDIFQPSIKRILPSSISNDKRVSAAAETIDNELVILSNQIKNVLHLPRLDELSGDILDHLAAQYHCDFYRTDFSDAVKRNQIRESIFWHRIKGTPRGVEKAISTFMVKAKVEENWEYGGEPYFFRIITKGLKYLADDGDFLRLVYDYKNVRSWLEEIIFDLTIEEPQPLYVAADELHRGNVTFEPSMKILEGNHKVCHFVFELMAGRVTFEPAQEFEGETTIYIAAADYMRGNTTFEPANFNSVFIPKKSNFQDNPVIKFYLHQSDEEIIFPDEEFDFAPDASFLRLYFTFPDKKIRYITLLNPREDLTAAEINAVGNFAVDSDLFCGIMALKKAKLVKRKVEEVIL